jgi:HEAT repeat protein
MPVSVEDVRKWLDAEEVDYPAAARLGPDALPALEQLAQGSDTMLASKATYLASLIGGDRSVRILETAGAHADAAVRVAAATGLKNLPEQAAAPIVERLLGDHDIGVRKMTVRSAAAFASPAMKTRLQRLAEHDPEPFIRDLAIRHLPR